MCHLPGTEPVARNRGICPRTVSPFRATNIRTQFQREPELRVACAQLRSSLAPLGMLVWHAACNLCSFALSFTGLLSHLGIKWLKEFDRNAVWQWRACWALGERVMEELGQTCLHSRSPCTAASWLTQGSGDRTFREVSRLSQLALGYVLSLSVMFYWLGQFSVTLQSRGSTGYTPTDGCACWGPSKGKTSIKSPSHTGGR